VFNPGVPTEMRTKPSRLHLRKQPHCDEDYVIRGQTAAEPGLPPSPAPLPLVEPLPLGPPPTVFDPREPLMSYTRLFDGSDAALVARLRHYVALSGDLRSGGWEAYMHRSEDFIRFSTHLMIVEMLQLHGGEAKRRFVVSWPKQR
jgi:hypothetical protein